MKQKNNKSKVTWEKARIAPHLHSPGGSNNLQLALAASFNPQISPSLSIRDPT